MAQQKVAPAQVRAGSAAADELHKATYPTVVEPAPEQPAVQPPPAQPPAGAAAAPPSPEPPAAPSPAAPVVETPAAPPAEGPAEGEDPVAYWRNRFKTVQGKYDAEVPRLYGEVNGLRGVLASMGTTAPLTTPTPPTLESDDEVLAKLEQEMGPEFVAGMSAAAARALKPHLERLSERIDAYGQQLQTASVRATHDARAAMFTFLDREIPGWEEVNKDPVFVNWLQQIDVFARQKRHDLLIQAWNANDGESVSAFFKAFRHEQTAVGATPQPGSGTPGHPAAPAAPPAPTRPQLGDFVAPGRPASPAPAGASGDEARYRRSEIHDFYRRKMQGYYAANPQEAERIEADIVRAGAEGRIDP